MTLQKDPIVAPTVAQLVKNLLELPQDAEVDLIGHCCGEDSCLHVHTGKVSYPVTVLKITYMGQTELGAWCQT